MKTINVTSNDLRKEVYGTPCGIVGESETALSHPLIFNFIDTFFSGVFDNVEVYEESGAKLIAGGHPTLKKLTITNSEFDYFTSVSKEFKKDIVSNLSDYLEIKKKKFEDIENKIDKDEHPHIICWLFSSIVSEYGGSFRCDYMDDGLVDLESE